MTTIPDSTEVSEADIASSNVDTKNSENPDPTTRTRRPISQWILSPKLFIGLLLLGFICFVIVDAATTGHVPKAVDSFLDWIGNHPISGVFVFIVIYFVATVLFIPGSVLTLGAGFVFSMSFGLGGGVALGTLSVFLGASLGAVTSFLIGRYLLREPVVKLSQKYAVFQALDQALQKDGLKIFVLLRLSPIIPFNAINYIGGVSAVSLTDYAMALLAILPGTCLYVFLGASAGSLTDSAMSGQDPTITIIVITVGVFFGVVAIWMTTRYAKNELASIVEERRLTEGEDSKERDDVEAQTSVVPTSEDTIDTDPSIRNDAAQE